MLEYGTGRGFDYYILRLWEMIDPDPITFINHGVRYDFIGKRHLFAWTNLGNSYRLDPNNISDEFKLAFYHGMFEIQTKIKEGTPDELINNSDWENHYILIKKYLDEN